MKNPLTFLLGLLFSFFSWQGAAQSYCIPSNSNPDYIRLEHVTYAGIDHANDYNGYGYNDYTNFVGYVKTGETNQMTLWVYVRDHGELYAYIDWNRNGILNDEGEVYYFGTKYFSTPGPHIKQIQVPENAKLGNTRMRAMIGQSVAEPCAQWYYGKAEDYTINITPVATSTFITTWTTTTPNESITIPTDPSKTYDYSVSWENDGVWENGFTGNATHTFSTPGTHTVAITGTFPAIYFNNSGDKDKIQSIEQWGNLAWSSMENAFYGCSNLISNATDAPNLSGVTSTQFMFAGASLFNGDVSTWDVSTITSMNSMFSGATAFNQDIGGWDVSNVLTMSGMFANATSFNQDLGAWDVSNVTTMNIMFANASVFNQDIGNWNVSNVLDMQAMFDGASSFNQNIGNWNVGNVANMAFMFYEASSFNQNIGTWNISNIEFMDGMFSNAGLSTANYDALLNGWSTQSLQSNVIFDGGNSTYCDRESARNLLINTFGWTITDGGAADGCDPTDYFITTWETTTPNESITIPTTGSGYDYSIDWGDGITENNQSGNATHSYADAGIYTVRIRGDFPRIYFNYEGDRLKIKSIEQWGTIDWSSMQYAFAGCSNLVANATDAPNLSGVTSTAVMFAGASSFNGVVSNWDVSTITIMDYMFSRATVFNQDIGNWDVSNVTSLSGMFNNATSFNQDIGSWNVGNVISMSNMFDGATAFNQDIGNWNVTSLVNTGFMFYKAISFNQDIGSWNVSNVTVMDGMFYDATTFNQDISAWDVSSVNGMNNMFSNAVAFDQNLGVWNVENVYLMGGIFVNTALSTANYDALLNGWSTQSLQRNISFSAGNTIYCNAESARELLINTYGWTITDGGQNCGACTGVTEYSASGWSNGFPDSTMKAVFAEDFVTTDGNNIAACSIEVNSGVTLTVAANTSISTEYNILNNGEIIFESTDNGNGELAGMGATSQVIGNATVQRYMSANRSYRMVSPAVTTTTSIMENWQEGVHNTNTDYSQNQNPNPGFGTHITGSQTGANGLDATSTGNFSMFTVDVANQQFQVLGNTNVNTLTAGEGYLMMVRGDRSINLNDNNAVPTHTVLRATGQLMVGNQSQEFTSPAAGAFVLFGNPYQSSVNVYDVLVNSANVNSSQYYVYDPTLGDNGAYVTVVFDNAGFGSNTSGSAANQYLQPGQGGQVATLDPGFTAILFKENNKTPGQFTATHVQGTTMSSTGLLTGQLYTQENYDNGATVHDSFGILFGEDNSNALTVADAVKPFNFKENLGINHDGTYLSFERRALPQATEIFPLFTSGYTHSNYVLKMEVNGLDEDFFYLDDAFTGTSTLLAQGVVSYAFNVDTTNEATKASDRFTIRVGERLAVEDNEMLQGITLYPNPMDAVITIANPKTLALTSASIYDMAGRLIKTVDLTSMASEITLDVSMLASATYRIVISGENGHVSKLMIKE